MASWPGKTEQKACLWLQTDLLLRRKRIPKRKLAKAPATVLGKRKRAGQKEGAGAAAAARGPREAVLVVDDETWTEAQLLARQLGISSEALPAMVSDDLGIVRVDPEACEPNA